MDLVLVVNPLGGNPLEGNPLGTKESDGEMVRLAVMGSSVTPELMDDRLAVGIGAVDELPAVVETDPLPVPLLVPGVMVSVSGVKVLVAVTIVVLSAAGLVKGVNG